MKILIEQCLVDGKRIELSRIITDTDISVWVNCSGGEHYRTSDMIELLRRVYRCGEMGVEVVIEQVSLF